MSAANQVLVSACLLGQPVRYDGRGARRTSDVLERWRREERIVSVCPEVAGDLGVPRPPAEITGGDGEDVLSGSATVVSEQGVDVTDAFLRGARHALRLAERHGIRVAVLKQRSPSCGSDQIYDGSFDGTRIDGVGVTTALLRRHGVQVFDEESLADADARLRELDAAVQRES